MFANKFEIFLKLKIARGQANWEIETERHKLLREFLFSIKNWTGQLPNLRNIFRTKEMDRLLTEIIDFTSTHRGIEKLGERFIKFVISTGYKDKPDVDVDGKPLLHRTTPINHEKTQGADDSHFRITRALLFKIYDRFDVNYVHPESGRTHFHVACNFDIANVAEKFLELGQDPNCLEQLSLIDPPLHTAVSSWANPGIVDLLLRNGADPNLANKDGLTPLHVIARSAFFEGYVAIVFFDIIDTNQLTVQVDARDNSGRTPLQWAVLNVSPGIVEELLDNGADLSRFTFPTESDFDEKYLNYCGDYESRLNIVTRLGTVIAVLEKRGYELDQSAFLTIKKLFIKYNWFADSEDLQRSLRDEEFVREAKKVMWNSSLSFYDVIQLSPTEAAKLFTLTDYIKFKYSKEYFRLPIRIGQFIHEHLCEIVSRRFVPSGWAVESFRELIHYRLPIECCEMIFEHLSSQDLYNINVAAGNPDS
uniref:Uncharacterized protein n=1 Tax=Trichogramma kaykai TaxID=54128 RepID=A0ABD2XJ76_9HYME